MYFHVVAVPGGHLNPFLLNYLDSYSEFSRLPLVMSQIDIAIYNIDLCSSLVCTLISKYNSSSSLRYSAQAAMEDPA